MKIINNENNLVWKLYYLGPSCLFTLKETTERMAVKFPPDDSNTALTHRSGVSSCTGQVSCIGLV